MQKLKELRPSHIAIVAGIGAVLVLAGVGIGAAVSDNGGGERVRAPFDRGPGGPGSPDGHGFRRGGPGGPGGPSSPGFHGGGPGFRKGGPGPGLGFDQNVGQVLLEINQALAKDASKLAGPILDKAVKDKKITKAQADAIRQRLSARAAGGGPGPGPPGGF